MSLASRKALGSRFLTTLTFVFVLANMIPIAWMVYCSFKDNDEILAGVIAPGRRHNDVAFLEKIPGGFLAGTQDGGVNRLDEKLALVKHVDLGTFATSYLLTGDTLWVLSSNSGLQALAIDDFSEIANYPIEAMAKPFGEAWKTLWVNDVAGSSIARLPDGIYFTYLFKDFPGILRFQPQEGSFTLITGLETNKLGMVRQLSTLGKDTLSLLTAKGYYRFNLATGSVIKALGVPAVLPGDVNRFTELSGNRTAFMRGKSILVFDLIGDTVTSTIGDLAGLGTSVLSTMVLQNPALNPAVSDTAFASQPPLQRLWVGNSQAVIAVDLSATVAELPAAETRTPKYSDEAEDGAGSDMTGGETTALLVLNDGRVLAGGTKGALSLAALAGEQPMFLKLPKSPFYFRWRNFVDLWRHIDFGLYLYNSFVVCGSVMILAMVLASLGGYALARYDFPGRSTFGYSVLATQMIPGIMLLLPIYLMYVNIAKSTGLVIKGTYGGLILTYAAYFVPFSIWILRGFFASIPKELEEAALIDGCGPFKAFFRIIIPSAMPGIVATGVYVFLSAWDELMFAWVLTSERTYTIPVGIRLFVGNFQNRYDLMMAAATVSTLPVMFLFFLMQKQIVSGLTAGAVKD